MKIISQINLMTLALTPVLPATTTAHWRLEEGTVGSDVTAAQDSSGNGFNQTSSGGSPK
jgi:hypothetical protein